jgi:hypothetical protein
MKLEKSLFQRSHLYFIAFFLFMVWGFWLTYFTRIFEQENYRMHAHGMTLILWCLMLIVQPYLIRTKRRPLHKAIGKFSYLLVPLMVFTTLDLLIYRFKTGNELTALHYSFIALVVNALVVFLAMYGLAIFHKNKPTVHARYMLCTAFPMFTPITDRILYSFFPSGLSFLPTIEGEPIMPFVGFVLADLMLLGLSIWDWRSHKRWNVFPFALLLLLAYHISVFHIYRLQVWRDFSNWLLTL